MVRLSKYRLPRRYAPRNDEEAVIASKAKQSTQSKPPSLRAQPPVIASKAKQSTIQTTVIASKAKQSTQSHHTNHST
jgi:hypothetical protein